MRPRFPLLGQQDALIRRRVSVDLHGVLPSDHSLQLLLQQLPEHNDPGIRLAQVLILPVRDGPRRHPGEHVLAVDVVVDDSALLVV